MLSPSFWNDLTHTRVLLTVQWWHSPSAKIFWYQIFSLALGHSSLSCKWDSLMSLFLHSGLSLFKLKTPDDCGAGWIFYLKSLKIFKIENLELVIYLRLHKTKRRSVVYRTKLFAKCTMVSPDCLVSGTMLEIADWVPDDILPPLLWLRLRLRAVTQVRSQESSHPGLSLVYS